ncbi:PREDICTED: MICAL-like protein 1 isoform X2 [Nicrophorus vespilloides]|nr:PREDICTED: MICAL-like protein 1 isoform X2 [Nicrophorus vespilloides]XP_017769539.1 PREDICTED: MICAL-like protein 1 isoform X2 [Nicrophorus vespilloides]
MGERRGTKGLELWCKKMTQGYPGVKIDNMTTSWRDGLAFCAIIHHFRPELIDFDKLNKDDVYRNNELAFRVAEQYLGIPALLEAEDMVEYPVPDRLSILTYLSQFYQAFEVSHGSQSRAVPKRPASSVPDRGIVSPASTSPPTKMAIRSTGGVTVGMPRRDPCAKCCLPVFIAERLNVGKLLYHRTCFRCARCSSQLTLANYYETETPNQFCCETCPDEVVATETTTSKKDVDVLLLKEKPIVGRSLSDEEKSMLSSDQQHFVTALDFPDVSGSDEFTRARSFFMSAQLNEDEDDHPPDLPKTKPPDTVEFKDNSESNDSGLLSTNSSVNSVKDNVVVDDDNSSSINSVKNFGDDKVVTKEPPPVTPTSASLVQARMSIFESSTLPTSNADDSVLESSPSQHDESVILVSYNLPAVVSDDSLTNVIGDDSVFESSPSTTSLNKRQEMRLESPKATPRKKYQQEIKPSPPEEQPPKRPATLFYESKRDNISTKRPATMLQSSKQSPQQEKLFFGEVKLRKTPPEKRAATPPKEDALPEIKLKPMLKIDSIKRLEEAEQETIKAKLDELMPVSLIVKDTNAVTEGRNGNSNRLMEENIHINNNDNEFEEDELCEDNNVDSLFENLLETSLEKDFNKLADNCLDDDEFALDDDFERLVQSLDKQPVNIMVKESEPIDKKDQNVSNRVEIVKTEENVAQLQMDVNKDDEDINIDNTEKCKEQEYPGDLNPFGDDNASLNPFGDDDVADEEVADNDKSLNPFSDDEDDEQILDVISPAKSTNPFEDDDDEDQPEQEIFKKPNPTARKLIPAPRISLPHFWNNEHKISGGEQQRGENSSFGSSTSISSGASSAHSTRRKKAAPRPPISNLLDQSSLQQSRPSDASPTPSVQNSPRPRKSKRAPAPPTSTPAANHRLLSPSDISPINESTIINSNSKSMTLEADEYEREKDVKDERNRTRQSCNSSNQSSFGIPNKSTYGKWKRKKGQAPTRPIPQKRSIKALPMTEVRRELGIIEVQQQGLEKQGVRLEQIIREKCEGPNSDADSAVSIEAEDLILQLFEVVNEKNELCRRQAELMYLQRQQRLEEEHAEIEYQIRCLMLQPEANKTDTDKAREEELILRLVDIVERRNEIIECLEMDRVREAEEDDSICNSMNTYATKRDENVLINSNESPKKKEKKKFRKKFKLKSSLSSSPKIDMDKDVDECEPSEAVVKDKKKKKFNLF